MYPEDLKYAKSHEWVRVKGGDAVIGISSYASGELGDIVFVDLPEVGTAVRAGDVMGSIESVKAVAELKAPVSGTVTEVNDELQDTPEIVNEDPYGKGWMVLMSMSDSNELGSLMDAAAYAASIDGGS